MNSAVNLLIRSLEANKKSIGGEDENEASGVSGLARMYEAARNALEYRADHLAKRAAIQRMVTRLVLIDSRPEEIVKGLMKELGWIGYVKDSQEKLSISKELNQIVSRYLHLIATKKWDRDWLVGMMSAELEESLVADGSYKYFTSFAFSVLKDKVEIEDEEDQELLLFVALDRVYAESDEARVAYHLYKLFREQMGIRNGENMEKEEAVVEETYKSYIKVKNNKILNKLSVAIRRQMGPLVLIRDMYYDNPDEFKSIVLNQDSFSEAAKDTLSEQLELMKQRVNRATFRSVLYVFLTKMIFVLLLEIPAERFIKGDVQWIGLGVNLLVPVILMWLVVARINLPNNKDQGRLIEQARRVIFEQGKERESDELIYLSKKLKVSLWEKIFLIIYGGFSVLIFVALISGLITAGLSVLNILVFVFFVSIIMFFAYRIRRTANIYTYRTKRGDRVKLWEMLALPVVALGGRLSQGLSRLNFLVLVFDFILEAPFKMLLGFIENWTAFVSLKRDEIMG